MRITVVGAGIIGCAVAHALASRGARVQVLDPRPPGAGATRASAGILSPHIEGHGEALLGLCLQSFDAYDAFIAAVRADTNRPIPYERAGTLQVARTDAEATALEQLAGELRHRRVDHVLLEGGALRRMEPALDGGVRAGLLVEGHAHVSARALLVALVDAARRRGATFDRQRAVSIDTNGDNVQVRTDAGAVTCEAVVIAAGSWSQGLAAGGTGTPPVVPIRGQLVQVRFESRRFTRVLWGSDCYLVPWADGRVLVGATVEDVGFDERSTAGAVLDLLSAAAALVPGLRDAAFDRVRVGLRPATPDGLPLVGPSSRSPRVLYATGHYRAGILLAPLTASLVAGLVLDGHAGPALASLSPQRLGL